jgi:hypothetical protein
VIVSIPILGIDHKHFILYAFLMRNFSLKKFWGAEGAPELKKNIL